MLENVLLFQCHKSFELNLGYMEVWTIFHFEDYDETILTPFFLFSKSKLFLWAFESRPVKILTFFFFCFFGLRVIVFVSNLC